MPRYFLHLYNDEECLDEHGVELADDSAAIDRARQEVRVMAAESVRMHGHLVKSHRIVVMNASDIVATVRFGDVIAVEE